MTILVCTLCWLAFQWAALMLSLRALQKLVSELFFFFFEEKLSVATPAEPRGEKIFYFANTPPPPPPVALQRGVATPLSQFFPQLRVRRRGY